MPNSLTTHKQNAMPAKWDETVDVIVVGSGFAGLSAAIEAHDAGASVKIIEKMDKPGGNSWINGGQVAAAGSALQKKQGIKDLPELMYKDMLAAGLNLNYPNLARIVAEQSNDTVEWTMKRIGAEYKEQINMMGGHAVPRTLQTANGHGSEVVEKQIAALKKDGVEVDFHHQMTRLFRERGWTHCRNRGAPGLRIRKTCERDSQDHRGPPRRRSRQRRIFGGSAFPHRAGSEAHARLQIDQPAWSDRGGTHCPAAR